VRKEERGDRKEERGKRREERLKLKDVEKLLNEENVRNLKKTTRF
jgi:hypothetical protein